MTSLTKMTTKLTSAIIAVKRSITHFNFVIIPKGFLLFIFEIRIERHSYFPEDPQLFHSII